MTTITIRQTGILPRLGAEIAAWLRQMKAAANRPIRYEAADGTMEFGRMIDRGVSRIRLLSGDPRI